eukprot:1142476-Pelagomonas_calceolata.AAC.1
MYNFGVKSVDIGPDTKVQGHWGNQTKDLIERYALSPHTSSFLPQGAKKTGAGRKKQRGSLRLVTAGAHLPASVDFTLISHSWASSWQVQLCEDAAPLPADWTGHTPAAASLCDLANELSKVGRGAHSGGAPAAASFPALSPQVVAVDP